MRQDERKEWRKLKAQLFGSATSAKGPDAFVRAVMARIPETEPVSFFAGIGLWFKIPTLAFATVLVLMFAPQYEEPSLSTEAILLETTNDPMGAAMTGEDVPTEDLIGFSMEEI